MICDIYHVFAILLYYDNKYDTKVHWNWFTNNFFLLVNYGKNENGKI